MPTDNEIRLCHSEHCSDVANEHLDEWIINKDRTVVRVQYKLQTHLTVLASLQLITK